jgi:hypothetical protein
MNLHLNWTSFNWLNLEFSRIRVFSGPCRIPCCGSLSVSICLFATWSIRPWLLFPKSWTCWIVCWSQFFGTIPLWTCSGGRLCLWTYCQLSCRMRWREWSPVLFWVPPWSILGLAGNSVKEGGTSQIWPSRVWTRLLSICAGGWPRKWLGISKFLLEDFRAGWAGAWYRGRMMLRER